MSSSGQGSPACPGWRGERLGRRHWPGVSCRHAASSGHRTGRHDPCLAAHRPPGIGQIRCSQSVCGCVAVPRRRLRHLPRVPYRARGHTRRRRRHRHRGSHPDGGARTRPGPAGSPAPLRRALAGDRHRGRRPAERERRRRVAQGARGAGRPDRLDPVRSFAGGRDHHDPLALAARSAPHAPVEAVAALLVRRDGIDPSMATFAARAAQCHVGLARRLARNEGARIRRHDVIALAAKIRSVGDAVGAAADLDSIAKEEAVAASTERDAAERARLMETLGADPAARVQPPHVRAQVSALERSRRPGPPGSPETSSTGR